jgi:murein DD-endopeptidase MepM/ murein hydrolase activator NlpD
MRNVAGAPGGFFSGARFSISARFSTPMRVLALLGFIAMGGLMPQVAHAISLEGQFIQGGMVSGQLEPEAKLRLGEAEVKVGPDGRFVFGFSRDQGSTIELVISHADGRSENITLNIAAQQYDIERVDGLPPATVNIPEAETQRRQRERNMVGIARAANSNALDWLGGFIQPTIGRVSGVYGSQRILNGEPRFPHYGLDFAAPVGTPIVAPAAGIITLAQPDFLLEGGIVIINHGHAVFSTLFHMSAVEVQEGQSVEAGEQIGRVGAKGRASGPHVDWRINWGSVRLDPALLLRENQHIEVQGH